MDEVRLIKPYVDFDSVAQDFQQVFESGVFTRGPYVKQFAEDLRYMWGLNTAF